MNDVILKTDKKSLQIQNHPQIAQISQIEYKNELNWCWY